MSIEQRQGFLLELAREAAAGRLVPAAFQRPYVWSASDVEALFTSVLKGWPIGNVLIWTPDREVDLSGLTTGRLGPVVVPPVDRPAIILDGQNRLATLTWAISQASGPKTDDAAGYSEMERETWVSDLVLAADYPERRIHFVDAARLEHPDVLPVGLMAGDNGAMNAAFRAGFAKGLSDDAVTWFDDIQHKIRQARVIVTNLMGVNAAEAKEAFLHIARAGVPVSADDLDAAMAWAEPGQAPRIG